MFAQMPLFVYRHFTGAVCTTSSDGRFASFLLASSPSNSSDMVRSRTSRSAVACSAHPIQNFLPGTTVAIVGAWHAPGRRLEPHARLCVAFAQVVKMKAGCVAHRSEETEVTSSVSVRVRKEFTADGKHGSRRMIRLIAVAGFLAFATSAQAMSPAPIPQPDGMITQVRLGCGPFRTRVNGVCVARTTIRQTRRAVRRGYRRGEF